ncbi:MAG: hypothetical protein KGH52_01705 [Candidatus Micrarchaeota archaeon]|nr:hypothetical protein [Candidatus Micrarchaeota archaeon]
MAKIYKSKNDKLIVYLPLDVVQALKLKEGDDMDFIRSGSASYLFAKKADIAELLTGKAQPKEVEKQQYSGPQALSADEIDVLKKLDTLKYGQRTKANVTKLLNHEERLLLKGMLKKKVVNLFAKEKGMEPLFGISKSVYERFLMRKGREQQKPMEVKVIEPQRQRQQVPVENENVKSLEKNGFVVLQSEAEASSLSLALEDSIRHGMVLGTRAFNKKFYIVMRSYFDRFGTKILKELKEGERKVDDVAGAVDADEDGARAILYLLAESGDVSEKRRDIFTLA